MCQDLESASQSVGEGGRRRPNPALWLYYQYGGRLPARYSKWILHDGTCTTWLLRVLIRSLVQIAPIAIALFVTLGVLGGNWPLAAGSLLLGILVVVRISLTSATDSVDNRLANYGFPPGHGSRVRSQIDEAAAARYRARWRQDRP
ncbi:DUF5313 family protein [Saccharopolyspora sp. ID03-671]|uniref:DUF5313 family protein n=1 Tax=Pseudonocardiaceae TaxID=2070 RepID=UPI001607B46A|nr:DUF5313 family protein [Prauserella isguenensis]